MRIVKQYTFPFYNFRYIVIYLSNLDNIETTHPGLLQDSKDSFLGIKRTSKPFSRSPIDLTLEQTVNADAASSKTGIVNLTDTFFSRVKWAMTHSLRTSIISKLMQSCNIEKTDDVTNDLKKSSIRHDTQKLESLINFFKQCTNPFSNDLAKDKLYNVSTGQSTSDEVYEFLSTVESEGENKRNLFIAESFNEPQRFDRAIQKNKIINFSYKQTKKTKINGQVKEIKIQRDVFGRLLYASLQNQELDLKSLLCYPLSPISFSLCHYDGNICKTNKSVITQEFLKHQPAEVDAPAADVHIYDGFYVLHKMKTVPITYRKVAEYLFKIVTSNKKEVHLLFDKFNKPTIKDYEHRLREEETTSYDIRAENKRPAELGKLLKSSNFKQKFVEFLIDEWATDHYAALGTFFLY